jgi:hypothetical protein
VTVGSLVRRRRPGVVIAVALSTRLQSVLESLSWPSAEIGVRVFRARVPSLGVTEAISLTSRPIVVGRSVKCRGRRQRVGLVIMRLTRRGVGATCAAAGLSNSTVCRFDPCAAVVV